MPGVAEQLNALLSGNIYAMMLVFSRVGTAMMLMPGLGDNYTPARVRLMISLGVSIAVLPIVRAELPPEPTDPAALFILICGEAIIGGFLGTIAMVFASVMETAGQMIAQQVGLSNAYIFNPSLQTQGSIPGTLLSLTIVVSLFATDLYQVLIRAVVESYHVFHYNNLTLFSDMTDSIAHVVSRSFTVSVEIASPFLAIGLLMYVAFGLVGRLLPQIQIFFLTLPLQILLGLTVFSFVAAVIVRFWMEQFLLTMRSLGLGG